MADTKTQQPDDDSTTSSSDDEAEDDLVLEGVVVRNSDVSDSEDSSVSEEEEDNNDDDDEEEVAEEYSAEGDNGHDRKTESASSKTPETPTTTNSSQKRGAKGDNNHQYPSNKKKKKSSQKKNGPEIIPVEFTFNDMNENYFHGLKTLLTSSSPAYASISSALSDLMIENISVGTVISTEADKVEGTVYGFASVLNVTTYQKNDCIKVLTKMCLDHCPPAHKAELETVLSGKTKRPAGFFIQSRMVNLPLEIVQVLHEQLVLDLDWAVENAQGGETERKSLNFGAFVRIAPSYRASGGGSKSTYYKYFDDEILAQRAEFTYDIALPKSSGMEETPYVTVIVITKTGHRAALKDLNDMVKGTASTTAAAM